MSGVPRTSDTYRVASGVDRGLGRDPTDGTDDGEHDCEHDRHDRPTLMVSGTPPRNSGVYSAKKSG